VNADFIWMILKAEMQSVGDKTVISGLRHSSDWYGLLITVGGDFSQTADECLAMR